MGYDMNIAIVTPCGPLHKWGYQHTAYHCIGSQAAFADQVYLVQSTIDHQGAYEIQAAHTNVKLLSSPETWFHAPA